MHSGAMASGATAEEVQAPSKVNTLESLRVIACAIVVISHIYEFISGQLQNPINEAISYGAVAVFFFISGIVNTWSFNRNPDIKSFYLSRAKRIYPTYLIALSLGILLAVLMGVYQGIFLSNYLFLQPYTGTINTNTPLWSLAYEVVLYLMLPLMLYNPKQKMFPISMVLTTCVFFWFESMGYSLLFASFFFGMMYATVFRSIPINFNFYANYGRYTYEVYVYHYLVLVFIWFLAQHI